ncbi:uncharacterized protein [Aegilops tauschii subsp. strangulata]|uniref:uncharacterized protein isoform X1 n=1 Tax=Aegilops tauschii subsp. strangulata TaxID=200361 RepID=UPI003CC873DE
MQKNHGRGVRYSLSPFPLSIYRVKNRRQANPMAAAGGAAMYAGIVQNGMEFLLDQVDSRRFPLIEVTADVERPDPLVLMDVRRSAPPAADSLCAVVVGNLGDCSEQNRLAGKRRFFCLGSRKEESDVSSVAVVGLASDAMSCNVQEGAPEHFQSEPEIVNGMVAATASEEGQTSKFALSANSTAVPTHEEGFGKHDPDAEREVYELDSGEVDDADCSDADGADVGDVHAGDEVCSHRAKRIRVCVTEHLV